MQGAYLARGTGPIKPVEIVRYSAHIGHAVFREQPFCRSSSVDLYGAWKRRDVTIRSESVIAAALLHGVFNGSAGLVTAYAVSNDAVLGELVASPVGAAGVTAFGLATVGIALSSPPSLTREFAHGTAASAPYDRP